MHYIYRDSRMTDFMVCPRAVLDREDLPDGAKILYMYLLDRARVSMQHPEWSDETGKVYLVFPIESLRQVLHRGGTVIKQSLKQLELAELIRRNYMGLGRPDRIYVKLPEIINDSETDGKPSTNYNNYNYNNYSYQEGESL